MINLAMLAARDQAMLATETHRCTIRLMPRTLHADAQCTRRMLLRRKQCVALPLKPGMDTPLRCCHASLCNMLIFDCPVWAQVGIADVAQQLQAECPMSRRAIPSIPT